MQKHIAKKPAKRASAPLRTSKPPQKTAPANARPDKFLYTASAYMFERRETGWFVARYVTSASGDKPKWAGPFETIESVCLSAARHMATELADRHTRQVEFHKIARGHPLYGLKPTTRLAKAK